jgi:DNA repair protein RadA/Sms
VAKTPAAVFVCTDCGGESIRWAGQCPHCRAWNTLEEFRPARRGSAPARSIASRPAVPVTEVADEGANRIPLTWNELNRVLGGGIVAGSVVLIGGEPGVGKSTLLMHVAHQAAARGGRVLYSSGEESAQQIRLRAARLGALHAGLLVLADNDLDAILDAITNERPDIAIVDSIQTVVDSRLDAAAGSVTQVREGAARVMRLAKESGVPVFLVGHVTKEGMIAGPRVLEHLVDTVLYLEGERRQDFRILRAQKNRFGSTEEIGIFSMGEAGLEEVADPSAALVDSTSLDAPGTAVHAAIEGSRPLLVELQGLAATAPQGMPRRTATGVDLNRLHMILAVLDKRASLDLGRLDVYVNVAGGIRVPEPAADLALALCVASSLRNRAIMPGTVVVGEIGLTGEVRRVGQIDRRLAEAARRGYTRALVPPGTSTRVEGIAAIEVADVREAMAEALGSPRIVPSGIAPRGDMG